MTRNYRPAVMRASDADRDAVVSDLSEHFQAGRLTAGEFDDRTGQALTARTWRELGELVADLPAARPAAPGPGHRPLRPPAAAAVRARGTGASQHRDRRRRTDSAGPRRVGLDLAAPARAAHRAPRDLPLRHSPAVRATRLTCRHYPRLGSWLFGSTEHPRRDSNLCPPDQRSLPAPTSRLCTTSADAPIVRPASTSRRISRGDCDQRSSRCASSVPKPGRALPTICRCMAAGQSDGRDPDRPALQAQAAMWMRGPRSGPSSGTGYAAVRRYPRPGWSDAPARGRPTGRAEREWRGRARLASGIPRGRRRGRRRPRW